MANKSTLLQQMRQATSEAKTEVEKVVHRDSKTLKEHQKALNFCQS